MLRLLVLVLVLVNVGFFAWSQNMLVNYGFAPTPQSEPQRLQRQLQPEGIELLVGVPADVPALPAAQVASGPAAPAASAPDPVAAAPVDAKLCLQSGFYTEAQAAALRLRLQQAAVPAPASGSVPLPESVPESAWLFEPASEPARWIVYMGKYASQDELDKKRAQLRGLGISNFESLLNGALTPGFSLGHYPTQAEADRALSQATARGVRTARVLQERAEQRGQRLKLPAVDTAMRQAIEALKQPLDRRGLLPCAQSTP